MKDRLQKTQISGENRFRAILVSIFGLFLVAFLIVFFKEQYDRDHVTKTTAVNSTVTTTNAPETTSRPSSENNKNNTNTSNNKSSAVKAAAKAAENSGFVTATSGYTFEKCVERTRLYLTQAYKEDFYNDCVFIAYLPSNPFYYDVIGYTKSGKSFDVQIYHGGGGDDLIQDWVLVDGTVK